MTLSFYPRMRYSFVALKGTKGVNFLFAPNTALSKEVT